MGLTRGGFHVHLASIIDRHPSEDLALVSQGKSTTYGELVDQVARTAGALVAAGIEPGDRVGIVCANNSTFCVSLLGALHAGAVAVPLNDRSPRPEISEQLRVVGARAVVLGPAPATRLDADGSGRLDVEVVIGPSSDEGSADLSYAEVRAHDPVERRGAGGGDPAVLLWTSGTAGGPKAATLTHANLLANQRQLRLQDPTPLGPGDVVMAVLPLSHSYGLNGVLGYGLSGGAALLLVENFDPSNAVESIVRHGVTSLAAVPPMLQAILDLPDLDRGDLSTLRRVSSGGAPLPRAVFEAMRDRFGVTISQGYGLTEAGPAITTSLGVAPRAGSVGVPLPGIEMRLVDEEGEDALEGDPGEVLVRGDNVFIGYWGDDEATAAVFDDDGWLRTGDIGVVDDDGFLNLVDRSKDIIIVSGFNVFPAEVETVLAAHPAVVEVGVTGVPHPHTGEAVVAHVVVDDALAVDEQSLIDHCARQLPRYKAPTKVRFVDALPRSGAGKLARRLITETV